MRILVLAPHPFFQLRGTPIDLDILLRALSTRPGVSIDVVVYGEGENRAYPNLRLFRAAENALTRGVKPGFSLKKLACDASMFQVAWRLVRENRYDVIHAGEEAVFMAMVFERLYGVPFVYDLDSSIAQQMVEKKPWLGPIALVLDWFESRAIRGAVANAPVCNALADLCEARGSRHTVTLHDISQLSDPGAEPTGHLRREVLAASPAAAGRLLLLYVGNLEVYQGIDLLVEAFAIAASRTDAVDLVIIGGDPDDIASYTAKASALGLAGRAHFLGQRPFDQLDAYLADADILVAPRIKGINTPMKVFPYLHSGRAVLVTDLPTHSQILTSDVAMLAPAEPEGFASAIVQLAEDPELRARLGRSGHAFVEEGHTFDAHKKRVDALYDYVASRL